MFVFLRRFLFLGLVFLPVFVFAYVSPGQPSGFVNDFVGVFSVEEKNILEEKLSNFSKTYGNEIAVVTINNLGGDYIENYAVKLFEEWGIGKKGQDNGVLVLVAMDERQMRIEVGYGLEGFLTDIQSNWIINNIMKPAFQQGNFYAGIDSAIDKIISATQGEVIPVDQQENTSVGGMAIEDLFYLAVFGFVILASILGQSKSWWAGGVIGGIIGVIIGFVKGFLYSGIIYILLLVPFGLFFDFWVSKSHARHKALGTVPWWMRRGGGHKGGGFGGFGGFGGGRSGGGGGSGGW